MKTRTLILTILLLALAACGRERGASSASTSAPASPPGIVARGRIDVEGGMLSLGLPTEGVVARVAVAEGDRVRRGQALIVADPTSARIEARLAGAKLAAARAGVELLETRLAAARTHASRLLQAAKQDAGDRQSADDAREAAAQAAAELDGARADVRTAQAERDRAEYVATQLTLRAPVDGQVLRLAAWPGMRVTPQGAPLLTLLPARPRIVRAELPEQFVAAIADHATAQVLGDDGRQQPLGNAHVLRIGAAYGPSKLQDDPEQHIEERSVECVLAFDRPSALRVGQRVLVRFAAAPR